MFPLLLVITSANVSLTNSVCSLHAHLLHLPSSPISHLSSLLSSISSLFPTIHYLASLPSSRLPLLFALLYLIYYLYSLLSQIMCSTIARKVGPSRRLKMSSTAEATPDASTCAVLGGSHLLSHIWQFGQW